MTRLVFRHGLLGLAPLSLSALAVALTLGLSAPVLAQDADPLVAKVNGMEVHESDLAAAEEEMAAGLQGMDPATKRETLVKFVTDMLLVSHAAELKKIDETPAFKRRLAFQRNRLLMDNLLNDEGKRALTPDAMQKVYEEAAKQMGNEQEVHARHILVATEDEAKQIVADLKKGADFAQLAKEKSKDPGASDGGDLGYFTREQMVPEFSEVAFKTAPGQISEPVKSQFGWHVIKVEDKRSRPVPNFDQVKGQIEQFVVRRAQSEIVAKLRQGAEIQRFDAKPADAKPADAKPAEAKPAEAKPADAKPAEPAKK